MHSCLIAIGLFSKAVESFFTEPKFSSAGLASTPNGALVLESARSLKEWMENSSNKSLLVLFSKRAPFTIENLLCTGQASLSEKGPNVGTISPDAYF